jgi:DivIVA domain-containing protein
MAESDRRRLVSSTPHLTPEQIAQRTFATSFRGFSEADVRAFLKRVSEELVVTRDREAELAVSTGTTPVMLTRCSNDLRYVIRLMPTCWACNRKRLWRAARQPVAGIRTS